MKKLFVCLIALLFVFSTALYGCSKQEDSSIDKEEPLQILGIGNSFTEDAFTYLWDILRSLGFKSVRTYYVFIPGGSLDYHLNCIEQGDVSVTFVTNDSGFWLKGEKTHIEALSLKNWDYVTLQQVSTESGLLHTYSALDDLISTVEQYAPDAKIMWHQTWAYQQDTTHHGFANYGRDQYTMYNKICDAVQEGVLTKPSIYGLIPSGTAVQNARTSSLGDTLTRDGYHLSNVGRFIAGLTYAGAITGEDISAVAFRPDGIDEATAQICISSAKAALSAKLFVTKINQ